MADPTVTNTRSALTSVAALCLRFGVAMGSALAASVAVLQLIVWIFDWNPLAGSGFLGAGTLILICAFSSLLYVLGYFYQHVSHADRPTLSPSQEEEEDKHLTATLLDELEAAFEDRRWEEVIKIGSVLSRPLWTTGKYMLRTQVGKLVEAASAYSDHPAQQARALVDDLGWTKFILGEAEEAKRNISHGIELAEGCGDYYLVQKAYRHLSGIALETGHLQDAITYYTRAEEFAEKLPDDVSKQEVFAGLRVNLALIRMKSGNWGDALKELEAAQVIYQTIADRDRAVKLFHFIGDVLFELGRLSAAKDVYREGLGASRLESRKDGILKNNIGLAKVALQEGDLEEARRAYLEAATVARELGQESLARELEVKGQK